MKRLMFCLMFLTFYRLEAQPDVWRQTNGPYGGLIYALTVNEENGHIYVGTNGGVFKAENSAATWVSLNSQGIANVRSLLYIKGILLVGALNGLYQLSESGDWSKLYRYEVKSFATSNDTIYVTSGSVVIRSIDLGETWTTFNPNFNERNSSIIINTNGTIFIGTDRGSILRSDDKGESFALVKKLKKSILSLTFNDDGHIFAGSSEDGIYRSTDNGVTWIARNSGLSNKNIPSMAINKDDHIFVGTRGGIYRSTDNGNSWTPHNSGLSNFYIRSIVFTSGNDALIGTERGVFSSESGTENWLLSNDGLIGTFVTTFTQNREGYIFAGTGNSGVFRTNDEGENWVPVNNGITYSRNSGLTNHSNGNNFMGTYVGGVYSSKDNGASWQRTNLKVGDIAILNVNSKDEILAANSHNVFISKDDGATWNQIHTDKQIRHLEINEDDVIFVGFEGGLIRRSRDNGVSWETLIDIGPTVLGLTIDGNNIYASTIDYIYHSSDNGDTWTATYTNPNELATDIDFYEITVVPSKGHLLVRASEYFTGDFTGIFLSRDKGYNWEPYNTGLNYAYKFFITSQGFALAATTEGAYKSTSPLTTVESTTVTMPISFNLLQNYPNPFNPETTIQFDLPKESFVELIIYNLIGQRIKSLAVERLLSGEHFYKWDGRTATGNLAPSGIYIYKLQTERSQQSRKLLLLR